MLTGPAPLTVALLALTPEYGASPEPVAATEGFSWSPQGPDFADENYRSYVVRYRWTELPERLLRGVKEAKRGQ